MDRVGWLSEVRDRGKSRSQMHDGRHESSQEDGSHRPPGRPEKPLARRTVCPYRTPTQVGRGKSPKVIERTSVKELGKMTPYLRKKGGPSSCLFSER